MGVSSAHVSRIPLQGIRRQVVSAETPIHSCEGSFTVRRPTRRIASEGNTTFEIAFRRAELKAALELVYRAYIRSSLIHMSKHKIRVTPYHALPTTEVFVAKDHGEIVCTMSLVRDAGLGLPMESIYDKEINQHRRRGLKLAEVSCLAFDRKSEACSFSEISRLMAFTAQCAVRRGVHQLVIAVHPRHAAFYHRFLAFEPIGEEKTYDAVRGKPAVAMALDLIQLQIDHPKAYRRLFGKPFPGEVLRYKPISPSLCYELRSLAAKTQAADSCGISKLVPACA